MDILLDSNIYLADPLLSGNKFSELFTYLRRTAASIILPDIVRDEVVERYKTRLAETARKAQSAHEQLWKLTQQQAPELAVPNAEKEGERLAARMHSPSKGVKVTQTSDYSEIPIQEVVRRGIFRKRPANIKGEELRDVVIWLLAIALAKKSAKGIILISQDSGFASEDGRLHPDLAEDLKTAAARVEFYRDIRDCIQDKVLDSEPFESEYLENVLPAGAALYILSEYLTGANFRDIGVVDTAEVKDYEFLAGNKYQVADNEYFLEFSLSARAMLEIRESLPMYKNVLITHNIPLSTLSDLAALGSPLTPFAPMQQMGAGAFTSAGVFHLKPTQIVASTKPWQPRPRKFDCGFEAGFSARLAGQKAENVEIDHVKTASFQEIE